MLPDGYLRSQVVEILVTLALLGLVGMVLPGFGMPDSVYLPLLGCAIPAGLALGVVRGAR